MYYAVSAVDATGNEGALSARVTTNLALLPVNKLEARVEDDEQAEVRWAMPGSMGQTKLDAHPLLGHYDKLQRTLIQQYEALGLNFRTTPSKVTENTKKGVDESDPMVTFYTNATKN